MPPDLFPEGSDRSGKLGFARPDERIKRPRRDERGRSPARQGLEAAAWGDSLDWKEISAAEITQRVTSKVQSGSIVLFHNAALHTPEALPGIIEALLQEGYTFVPISELLLDGDYTIDHTGRQLPA